MYRTIRDKILAAIYDSDNAQDVLAERDALKEEVERIISQLAAVTKERDELRDTIDRISQAYKSLHGTDDCPPAPHGCDKCEIHYLLDAYKAKWGRQSSEKL